MRRDLDGIWIDAADQLGIAVVRGGEAYVHWDGRRLHIADDEHLDDDDTVAQLVLHEICHAFVQGPAKMALPDWGLDNTNAGDAVNEAAAVRVQAHVLGAFGLRDVLFPTTIVREFYDALPEDAFLPVDDESARLGRNAMTRLAEQPVRGILLEALEKTRAVVEETRGEPVKRHRKSGLPLGRPERVCGDCTWRTSGGLCRQAPRRAYVKETDAACVRWEGALDCLACGACCRSAYDLVPVTSRDVVVHRHPSLMAVRSGMLSVRREGDRCAALSGPHGGPYACVIYDDRPKTCRDFERGGKHCIDARRRVGMTF